MVSQGGPLESKEKQNSGQIRSLPSGPGFGQGRGYLDHQFLREGARAPPPGSGTCRKVRDLSSLAQGQRALEGEGGLSGQSHLWGQQGWAEPTEQRGGGRGDGSPRRPLRGAPWLAGPGPCATCAWSWAAGTPGGCRLCLGLPVEHRLGAGRGRRSDPHGTAGAQVGESQDQGDIFGVKTESHFLKMYFY